MKRFRHTLVVAVVLAAVIARPLFAQQAEVPSDSQFERLHRMLRPQPGEARWMEIDWHPSIWEARQKAAAEGKPIFILAGSGGAPPAGC